MGYYEDSINTIAKGAGIAFAGMLISKLFTYGFRMIAARFGAEDYGLISLSMTIAAFAVILCTLGLETGITRYVAYYIEKKNFQKIKGILIASFAISLACGAVVTVALMASSRALTQLLFPNIQSSSFIIILNIILLTIPLHVSSKMLMGTFRAFKRPEYEVYTKNITESTVKLILTIAVALLGFSIIGVSVAYTVSILCSVTLGYFLFWKILPKMIKEVKAKFMTKELLKYSVPLLSLGTFITIMVSLDTLMLGHFKDEYLVGIYNAVVPTAQLMFVFPFAILTLFIPTLSGLYALKKKKEFNALYKAVTKWVITFSVLTFCVLLIYSKELLQILFGRVYAAGQVALIILALGYLLNFAIYSSQSILMVVKKTKLILYNCLIIATINIVLNLTLIPKYGIEGAAIATGISYVIWGLLLLYESHSRIGIIPFKAVILRVLLSGTITALAFFIVKGFWAASNIFILLVSMFSVVMFYGLNLFIWRCFDKDDKLVLNYFNRVIKIKVLDRFN